MPFNDEPPTVAQTQAKAILEQSVSFADSALKRLVAYTIGEEVDTIFDDYNATTGEILIETPENKHRYLMYLDIVQHDYMLDLGEFKGNGAIQQRMVFLLNTVKVLFNPIKDFMRARIDEDGSPLSFNYVLQVGLNTTMFLDKNCEKRIGIILKKIDS